VYYTVYSISADATYSERNKTQEQELVYLRDILGISDALCRTEGKGKSVFSFVHISTKKEKF
jgi:hypothetical protein